MHYMVTFNKPNNIVVTGDQVKRHPGIASVREFVRMARQYSGSYEIVKVEKVTSAGNHIEVPLYKI